MKSVFILYNADDWHKDIPLENSPETRKSFEYLYLQGIAEGVQFYRASISWHDKTKNVFLKSWTYQNSAWKKIERPIRPDFIFDKIAGKYDYSLFDWKAKTSRKTPFLNTPSFRASLNNKLTQYLIFSEYMPQSFLASNKHEFVIALQEISSEKVVIKPLYGSGGFGIIIDEKSNINNKLIDSVEFPVFIQEFISPAGIPWRKDITDIADLRVVFIDHNPIYALTRIAKEGSLFTNLHQGASAKIIPLDTIPENIFSRIKKISSKLDIFQKNHYSLDFIFSKNGTPFMIEANTTPGFDLLHLIGEKQLIEEHNRNLIRAIIRS